MQLVLGSITVRNIDKTIESIQMLQSSAKHIPEDSKTI